jgi:pimeloyl-ACP methyl ester carboxylesterase
MCSAERRDATVEQHVILLHSSGSSGRQWRDTVQALHGRCTVHLIDFHGHGAQPAWSGAAPMRLADEAALVEPLLERLGGAHLVGHSYGGAVALDLARRRPALVHSVVAFEPVLFALLQRDAGSTRELQTIVGVVDAMREQSSAGRPEAAAQVFIDFWSGAGTWDALPAPRREAITSRTETLRHQFDALFGDLLSAADLAHLSMPLLLLFGTATVPVTRRIVQIVGAALPGARVEALPGMGHMGPLTHPAAFNRRVAAFLSSVPARQRTRAVDSIGV